MSTPTPDFTISPRQFSEDDAWFVLIANPDGSVNVPISDPYQMLPDPAAPWPDTEPQVTEEIIELRLLTADGKTGPIDTTPRPGTPSGLHQKMRSNTLAGRKHSQ